MGSRLLDSPEARIDAFVEALPSEIKNESGATTTDVYGNGIAVVRRNVLTPSFVAALDSKRTKPFIMERSPRASRGYFSGKLTPDTDEIATLFDSYELAFGKNTLGLFNYYRKSRRGNYQHPHTDTSEASATILIANGSVDSPAGATIVSLSAPPKRDHNSAKFLLDQVKTGEAVAVTYGAGDVACIDGVEHEHFGVAYPGKSRWSIALTHLN